MRRIDYKELSLSNQSANIYSIEILGMFVSMDMITIIVKIMDMDIMTIKMMSGLIVA